MAEVTLTIDSKQFRMACEDGQEGHLIKLAAHVDARVKMMRESFGEIGDLRLAVMAALMVSDEYFEEKRRGEALVAQSADALNAREAAASSEHAREAAIARSIDALASRVERITQLLSPGTAS